ncbi:MAG: DNA polymerase I [Chloroflexi bacterium]|nr:DNA polymerase I [Chloroflexota bacterium]
MADRLVLIDGNALVHRAFHALPPLTSPRGEPVNAVYGFVSMLVKVLGELKPRYLAAAFDTSAPTFRSADYEAYKATRTKAPDELRSQFQHVYRMLEALSIPIYRLDGFEADDLLGALSCQAAERGLDVIILTGDQDAMQLVGPSVRVLTSRRGFSDTVLYDEAAVRERYGLEPRQLPDVKALRGDVSDNIPGVPGVGDKTASRLLAVYGSVEELYQRLDGLAEKQRALLAPHADQVRLAKKLATIVWDLDVTLDLDAAELRQYDLSAARDVLHELGFRTMVDRLPAVMGNGAGSAPTSGQLGLFDADAAAEPDATEVGPGVPESSRVVRSDEEAASIAAGLRQAQHIAVSVRASSPRPTRADLVGIGVATDDRDGHYLPFGHLEANCLSGDGLCGLAVVFEDASVQKLAHNAKPQLILLERRGVTVRGLSFDTEIAAYLLDSSTRSPELRDLVWARFQQDVTSLSSITGTGKNATTLDRLTPEQVGPIVAHEAELVSRIAPLLRRDLEDTGQLRLFEDIEMPLVPVLVTMERTGVAVDVPYLQSLSTELYQRLVDIEKVIYEQVGHAFNINSTQQLSAVLYDELKLPRKAKTRSGQGSTGADVLEELRTVHPIVELILEHRQLQKLKSTYVDALPLLVDPETGRVHTSFNQTVAATGRLSSSEPNLQNIPIRTPLGRRVRRAFIPGLPGYQLVSADYSQIELRVLAHETDDPTLVEAFAEGLDIHAATAAEVMGVDLADVNTDMRRFAKIVNFGVLYGMSEYGLASRTDLPAAEAAAFIKRYFDRFGTVKEYQERIVRAGEQQGYVSTFLGRRRPMPELKSKIYSVRQAGVRMAVNHPIQGAASDIMKIAMIQVQQHIEEQGLRTRMLLQVHDELVFESPEREVESFGAALREIMRTAVTLRVPLDVELKVGENWEAMTGLQVPGQASARAS